MRRLIAAFTTRAANPTIPFVRRHFSAFGAPMLLGAGALLALNFLKALLHHWLRNRWARGGYAPAGLLSGRMLAWLSDNQFYLLDWIWLFALGMGIGTRRLIGNSALRESLGVIPSRKGDFADGILVQVVLAAALMSVGERLARLIADPMHLMHRSAYLFASPYTLRNLVNYLNGRVMPYSLEYVAVTEVAFQAKHVVHQVSGVLILYAAFLIPRSAKLGLIYSAIAYLIIAKYLEWGVAKGMFWLLEDAGLLSREYTVPSADFLDLGRVVVEAITAAALLAWLYRVLDRRLELEEPS